MTGITGLVYIEWGKHHPPRPPRPLGSHPAIHHTARAARPSFFLLFFFVPSQPPDRPHLHLVNPPLNSFLCTSGAFAGTRVEKNVLGNEPPRARLAIRLGLVVLYSQAPTRNRRVIAPPISGHAPPWFAVLTQRETCRNMRICVCGCGRVYDVGIKPAQAMRFDNDRTAHSPLVAKCQDCSRYFMSAEEAAA